MSFRSVQSAVAFPPPQPGTWAAPTATEQALYEAKLRGDFRGYVDTLARTLLFHRVHRAGNVHRAGRPDRADRLGRLDRLDRLDRAAGTGAGGRRSTFPVFRQAGRGFGRVWEVFTDGMLPVPGADVVFDAARLGWFADVRVHGGPQALVVNPGSPCEAWLPMRPPHSLGWTEHARRLRTAARPQQVRTLRSGGVLHGPVAHGLACGALLCVHNASLWNTLAWHGTGWSGERERLRAWWGITTRGQWRSALGRLLDRELASPVWEFALSLRHDIARDFGGHVDIEYWRQAAARVLRDRAESTTVLTPDGVTSTDPRPEAEIAAEAEARIQGVQHLIGRITRYEARMRADGVLAPHRYVVSVDAWDLGRASKMARWGVGARLCTLPEAEAAVVRAGRTAAHAYRSWADFSAGYVLGRCLHFDEEEFGSWYTDMVEAHHLLMEEPDSPWLHLPFR